METEEREIVTGLTVDLSKQTLKKIERANNGQKQAEVLILNDNEIQRLDNLDSYSILKKLYLANNQLIRMYGVLQLIHLEVLDLSNNSLVTIEGLKDLKNLKELYLAKNKIKVIEHLNNNLELEKMDLSENNITHISDISYLKCLKELYLHGNKLTHLRQCEKNIPENIEVLTLHSNLICDLNEVSHLVHFNSIKELSFADNPCVNFIDERNTFNYRPFIKNWCSSLIVLDTRPLDDIECLKAEWLYSQGRGRSFRPGEQAALVEYLSNVCPIKESNDEAADVKKLKLILSKAQQHQKQLREQLSTGNLDIQDFYKTPRKKKLFGMPERMVASCQDSPSKDRRKSPDLMMRSLDSHFTRKSSSSSSGRGGKEGGGPNSDQKPLQTSTTFIPVPDALISPELSHAAGPPFISPHPRPSSLSGPRSSRSSSSRNSPHSTPESKRKSSTVSLRKENVKSSPVPMKKQGKPINSGSGTSPNLSPSLLRGRGTKKKGKKGLTLSFEPTIEKANSVELVGWKRRLEFMALTESANKGKMAKNEPSFVHQCSTRPSHNPKELANSTKETERNYGGTSEEEEEEEDSENCGKNFLENSLRKASPKRLNRKRCDRVSERDYYSQNKGQEIVGKESGEADRIDGRAWKAAICIQRRWRGYRARNLNGEVLAACKDIQLTRMQEYITKVIREVEAARVALESNRKLQVLQMQAINALWKKMIAFQASEPVENSNESKLTLQQLTATCSNLNKQVEGLQILIKTMQNSSVSGRSAPMATQTEIVAVHTPQGDGKEVFPYGCLHSKGGIIFSSPAKGNCNISREEVADFVSPKETDLTEIFTNKNLDGVSPSDRELFSVAKFQDEKCDGKSASGKLSKPLGNLNELSSDLPGLAVKEEDLLTDRLSSKAGDVPTNGCDS